MTAPVLMVQGTASGVGKSVVVAGLCRLLRRRGLRVAPFKAQNMSNNAAVTADGGEIGRSTAVQAAAAGTEPTVEMNPILLKPEADATSQLVVLGVAHGSRNARDYLARTDELWPAVAGSLAALRTRFDVVVAEGAGSPAELNLRARDIVNMRVAREADAAVLLVGDIDRGGVFAQLLGTLDLLEPPERARVKGLIVNRFRGDPSLFADGGRILEERSGLPLLGVVPMVPNFDLPEEDGAALERRPKEMGTPGQLRVVVVRLPRIANFDEFAPLAREPGVALEYADRPERIAGADLVVLPGTKAAVTDLAFVRERGIADALVAARSHGTPILGVCGGYQMLGRCIHDPHGIETTPASVLGLELLPHETVFRSEKRVAQVRATVVARRGIFASALGQTVDGYEIRVGWPTHPGESGAVLRIEPSGSVAGDDEGAVSEDGLVTGTSVHGLFEDAAMRRAAVSWMRQRRVPIGSTPPDPAAAGKAVDLIDRWADVLAHSLAVDRIISMLRPRGARQ